MRGKVWRTPLGGFAVVKTSAEPERFAAFDLPAGTPSDDFRPGDVVEWPEGIDDGGEGRTPFELANVTRGTRTKVLGSFDRTRDDLRKLGALR